MRDSSRRFLFFTFLFSITMFAFAEDDPGHERHELMEGVRDAAEPVIGMLKGEREFDTDTLMLSLQTFSAAGGKLGDLFPEGSQGGEAAPAIWEDREGFDAALLQWSDATAAAIAAQPATMDAARPMIRQVMGACKNCHDSYRIEEEE
jgi:cytochrome c556